MITGTGKRVGVVMLAVLLGAASWGCGSSQSQQDQMKDTATALSATQQQFNEMSVSLESARQEIDELEQAFAAAIRRIESLEKPTALVIRDKAGRGILSLDKRGLIVLSKQRNAGTRINSDGIVVSDQNGIVRAALTRGGENDHSTLTLGTPDKESTSVQMSVSKDDASMTMGFGKEASITMRTQDTAQGRFSAINLLDKDNKVMWTTTVTSDGTVLAGKTSEIAHN